MSGGLLLYAGHPPLGIGTAGLVALVPLIWLGRDIGAGPRPLRTGAAWGLLAGLVFFVPLLYWLAVVEFVALPLLALVQAAFVAAFVAGLAAWADRPAGPVAAVVLWVALEALRSTVPWGGFPWGLLGYTQATGGPFLGLARTVGVLGVSTACAAVAAGVAAALHGGHRAWRAGRGGMAMTAAMLPPLAVIGAVTAVGLLGAGAPPPPTGRTLDVAAVQGNDIADTRSLTRRRVLEVGERMLALTEDLAADGPTPDVVVWPENALDADVTSGRDPELAVLVDQALATLDDTPLLAGMRRVEGDRVLNAKVLFTPSGQVAAAYDKRSLVPFGEYVPLRRYVSWFPPLERAGNFSAGHEPAVFELDAGRLATVICFENIFPALTRSQVRAGAEVLVVSTNNASFGYTPASSQHITFSQLRAVESGRWVLHAGLSGSSAVIDPHGRVHERTGLFEQAVVRTALPLVTEDTAYIRTGDVVGPVALAVAAVGALALALPAAAGRWRRREDRR